MENHQHPFDPDKTYEAAVIEVVADHERKQLGLGVHTPGGERVLIGLSGKELLVLLAKCRGAHRTLEEIAEWQPFPPV